MNRASSRRGFVYTDPASYAKALYALTSFLALLGVWKKFRSHRAPSHLCPGPAIGWSRLFPWNWLFVRGCWYDLSGLRPSQSGLLICPECGSSHRTLPPRSSVRHVRHGSLALAAAMAGVCFGHWRLAYPRHWVPYAPTPVLLSMERRFSWPSPGWEELKHRIRAHALSESEKNDAVAACVANLADDQVTWNALEAMDMLRLLGTQSIPKLVAALDSADYQQRQLAAYMLREMDSEAQQRGINQNQPQIDVSFALIRVTVEGLQNDDVPRDRKSGKNLEVPNAADGFVFLMSHYEPAREPLRLAVASKDPQQRFLAAAIVGLSHDTSLADLVTPVLAEHLGDNNIEGDARLATAALAALGPEVAPRLFAYLNDTDPMRKDAARLIYNDVRRDAWTAQDAADFKKITVMVHRPTELARENLGRLLDGVRFP